jgi:hypothetical protein
MTPYSEQWLSTGRKFPDLRSVPVERRMFATVAAEPLRWLVVGLKVVGALGLWYRVFMSKSWEELLQRIGLLLVVTGSNAAGNANVQAY